MLPDFFNQMVYAIVAQKSVETYVSGNAKRIATQACQDLLHTVTHIELFIFHIFQGVGRRICVRCIIIAFNLARVRL